MRVSLLALALTGFAGLAGAAGAQAHPPGHTGPMKAQAAKPAGKFIHAGDKNKDQRIDPAEWVAIGEARANFAKADKNRDGKLDGAEFVAWKYPNMTRRP
ncbi:MAG: hypothetical protein KY449_08570 [Proteobacteria bacterium]|nr:hypothetical protein [Pseudomonadota bacterium]